MSFLVIFQSTGARELGQAFGLQSPKGEREREREREGERERKREVGMEGAIGLGGDTTMGLLTLLLIPKD